MHGISDMDKLNLTWSLFEFYGNNLTFINALIRSNFPTNTVEIKL